jgi:hypothetical protein
MTQAAEPSIKKQLEALDEAISQWERVCRDYPKYKEYKEILYQEKQRRAELANRIGKK